MWNPRRVFLLLCGLVTFVACYLGYEKVLGSLDGLPVLPENFGPKIGGAPPAPFMGITPTDQRLWEAHGVKCPEERWPIKIDMRSKNILLAADRFQIVKEGQFQGSVRFSPLSIAVFGKNIGPERVAEINTMYCDLAYVTFDKPVKTPQELDGRTIVSAVLMANPEMQSDDPRKGMIRINNTRSTRDRNDDIEVLTQGPVYYFENPTPGKPNVQTLNAVQMFDYSNTNLVKLDRTVPRQPTVTGNGLGIYFLREEKKKDGKEVAKKEGKEQPKKVDPKLARNPNQKPPVTGVEKLELMSNVTMALWMDENQGFVPAAKTPGKVDDKKVGPEKGKLSGEKKLLKIETLGLFRYVPENEHAHFEKPNDPKPGDQKEVRVTRAGRTLGEDVLQCDYLDIFMQRKQNDPKAPKAAPKKQGNTAGEGDLELKRIHAWGETVTISSDSEMLSANGTDLTHDALNKTTILKGSAENQVQVIKEGNLINAEELHLIGEGDEMAQVHAIGAGSIGMGEYDRNLRRFQKSASWTERLVYAKVKDKNKIIEVMTFVGNPQRGNAKFTDHSAGAKQEIEAQQLKVWLLPRETDSKKAEPKKGEADPSKSARPSRLEATGNVKSISPDMVIKKTDYLNVWFKDVPKLIKEPMKAEPKKKADLPGPKGKGPGPELEPKLGPKIDPKELGKDPGKKDIVAKEKPKIPIEVVANTIETWINRDPQGQMELDKVHADGDVDVHQAPSPENESGIDVTGKSLDVTKHAEGNVMIVLGDPTKAAVPNDQGLGRVHYDKLTLFGYHITIDQRFHTAIIKDAGQLFMLSDSDMEGKKLSKPMPIVVYWKHRMEFFGADKLIHFHGSVQAEQDKEDNSTSKIRCEWMQVTLDKPILLSEEARNNPTPKKGPKENPKIDNVQCFSVPKDENLPRPAKTIQVLAVDETRVGSKLVGYQSLRSHDMEMVNTPKMDGRGGNRVDAATNVEPGLVLIWKPGQKDMEGEKKGVNPKAPVAKKKPGELAPDEEMKLTIVQFDERMRGEDLRKRARFTKNVRVVHMPSERHDLKFEIRFDTPPKGAYTIDAETFFEVFTITQKEIDPGTKQIVERDYNNMKAEGNVRVNKIGEFQGEGNRLTYDESKSLMIIYGTADSPATVTKIRGQGVKPEVFRGEKIKYDTKNKTFDVEGATTLGQ